MRKSFGNPELPLIVCTQSLPNPVTKRGGTSAKIHGNIKYFTDSNPNQLALRIFNLIVQPTQNTFGRAGVIILYKLNLTTHSPIE